MANRGTDWNSVTDPIEQSMGMVAQHMLRAPQLRYRLDMERRKLDNDTMVSRAQAGNYDAQTAKHGADAQSQQQRNEAFARIRDGGGARIHAMMSGQMPKDEAVLNQDIADAAMAWGISGADAIKVFQAAGQSVQAQKGVPTDQIARSTGNITTFANNEADNAAKVPTVAPGAMYRINGEWKTNPSAAAQREASYETTTTDYPEIPAQEAVPPTPAKSRWFGKDTPEIPGKPAVPGQPARKVTTRRKLGDFNQITEPTTETPAATPATQDFVQPQDPDDSDTPESRAAMASPQSKVDAVIREAQRVIKLGADPAAVIKRAKDLHGVTLTFK